MFIKEKRYASVRLLVTFFVFAMVVILNCDKNISVAYSAETQFSQGQGYQQGAYDKNAIQPSLFNWTRQSRFNGPAKAFTQWTFRTGDDSFASPVIGADGTIYLGAFDNKFYAINPNGEQKWTFTAGDGFNSSAALGSDGTIYVGCRDGKVYAINSNGTKKWEFPTGDSVYSSPAIDANGIIYIGSQDKKLYAIKPDGTLKWAFQMEKGTGSSPAIGSDGTIYIGSDDKKLYAIKSDGTKKWEFATDKEIWGSPAIGQDGTIYIRIEDYNTGSGKLYAISTEGKQKWYFKIRGFGLASPAIAKDGTIYIGSDESKNSKLYALDVNGKQKWYFPTGDCIVSTPIIGADGNVYFASWDKKLYAVNSSGKKVWEYNVDDIAWSSPALGNGIIYTVGSNTKTLYAIGAQDYHVPVETIWSYDQVLGQKGAYPFAGIYEFDNLTIDDDVIIYSENISQLVLNIKGTLKLGKNVTFRVRNGFYSNAPGNPISRITAKNLNSMGNDAGGFRVYKDMFGQGGKGGKGGDGDYGPGYIFWFGYDKYEYIGGIGGGGGSGGGGGYGGGIGGVAGKGGKGTFITSWGTVANGADGSPGINNGGNGGGLTGGSGGLDDNVGEDGKNGQSGSGGGGGGGGNSGSGGKGINGQYPGDGAGGGGGGGGGYGGGILTIIADLIVYDYANPPHFLVPGQKGGSGGYSKTYQGQIGENGQGGLLIINSPDYSPSPAHWNLGTETYGFPRLTNWFAPRHGVVTGNPQKVFINGIDSTELDIMPLEVTDTDPCEDSYYVARDKVITVNFSKRVVKGLLFDKITMVKSSDNLPVKCTYSLNGTTLTIKPNTKLDYGTQYTIVVPQESLKDKYNNTLSQEYSLSFNTIEAPVVTGLQITPVSIDLVTGKSAKLNVKAQYNDGTTIDVTGQSTYQSSNDSIASVSTNGEVKGNAEGETSINIVYGGKEAEAGVTVTVPLIGLVAEPALINLEMGNTIKPVIKAKFKGAPDKVVTDNCTWSPSNSNVASVTTDGTITGTGKGSARVTASYKGIKSSITVKVTPPVQEINIAPAEATIFIDSNLKLKVTAKYTGDNKVYDITSLITNWKISDETILSIKNGTITGKAKGDCNIEVTYQGKSAMSEISVTKRLSSLTASPGIINLNKGEKYTSLKIMAKFYKGEEEEVTNYCSWTNSNSSVADFEQVDRGISINAKAAGKTKLTAKWGGKSIVVNITVK
ncbi:MAG: beta-alanine-activating enzyme beta-propeller domain-containing protein [Desulfitobacteriaceae bacterium]